MCPLTYCHVDYSNFKDDDDDDVDDDCGEEVVSTAKTHCFMVYVFNKRINLDLKSTLSRLC